ncbi:MAG: aspartate carbamoyltransferase regulatory subunit [Candidatus Atabeyarchaeum deiterrae]
MENTLRARKIKDGTVIDHLNANTAFHVLRLLGLLGETENVLTVLINVESQKLGRKDLIKIENRELNPREADLISVISPDATINVIRNFTVVEKKRVGLPSILRGVKCPNPTCITNTNEPAPAEFAVTRNKDTVFRCKYCNREYDMASIRKVILEKQFK